MEKNEQEQVTEYLRILNKNKHHFDALYKKLIPTCLDHFSKKRSKILGKVSEREKIKISNKTYFIEGYEYILAYRVFFFGKNSIDLQCNGFIEHTTKFGKIYELLDKVLDEETGDFVRVIHTSHYFDRLILRNEDKNY